MPLEPDAVWKRLVEETRSAPPRENAIPFAFTTRVIAQWKAKPEPTLLDSMSQLYRRSLVGGLVILTVCFVFCCWPSERTQDFDNEWSAPSLNLEDSAVSLGRTLKPWLGLGAIFLLGMICGVLVFVGVIRQFGHDGRLGLFLTSLGAQAQPPQPLGPAQREPADPRRAAGLLLGRMEKRLHLSPAQKAKIEPLLQETSRQIRELQSDARERAHTIVSAAQEKVKAELTTDQLPEYAKMREEQARRIPFFNGRRRSTPFGGGAAAPPEPTP